MFRAATLCALAVLAMAGEAQACAVVRGRSTPADDLREARAVVQGATAIIDAEVVEPYRDSSSPAVVRAERVLKGPAQAQFKVGAVTSCDLTLDQAGERLRLILYGGPDVFHTPYDQANARYEDRVLGSDRRKVWPYRAGAAAH